MKITNDKTENSQMYLTIEVAPEEVEESMEISYKKLVKQYRVPGFRKGKAPRHIFERYLGRESLMEEAINEILPKAYEKAVEEHSIKAIAQPQFEVEQLEPMVLKATVPLPPTVELGDYKSLRIEKEKAEVTEDKVDAVIEQLRHQWATWEPVEGRPLEYNDLLAMDITGHIGEKSVLDQKGAQYQVIEGQTFPVVGFPEQLIGLNPGEEKVFDMTYPEDYGDTELAGQAVTFKVKAVEIKKEVLPEISDEFAKSIGEEFQTIEELRERARKDMLERAEERVKADFEDKVLHSLAEMSKVAYPPIMVESETNRILNQQFQRTNQSLEDYLKAANKTEEQLREELKPTAEHRLVDSLVLGKVAEAEAIEVSEGEIDLEIEEMTKNSKEKKEELTKFLNDPQVRESISRTVLTRKTIAKLTEYALVREGADPAGTVVDEGESDESSESDKPKATRARKKKKEETI